MVKAWICFKYFFYSPPSFLLFSTFLFFHTATLKPSVENAFGSDYDYGYATGYYPGYETSGYDVGVSGSSYTSTGGGAGGGHYKRSADTPSFMNLPIVQRLAARVHEAIENYDF